MDIRLREKAKMRRRASANNMEYQTPATIRSTALAAVDGRLEKLHCVGLESDGGMSACHDSKSMAIQDRDD